MAIPPCTWEETLQIRLANCGDDADEECPLDKLRERYDLWGGVLRTVIQKSRLSALAADEVFKQLKLVAAMRDPGTYNIDHRRHSGNSSISIRASSP